MPKLHTGKLINTNITSKTKNSLDKPVKPSSNGSPALSQNGEPPSSTGIVVKNKGKKNNIDQSIKDMAVSIDSLTPDPNNARIHPDRNMRSIVDSLLAYGQVKPIVVRKSNRIIVAGNGTTEAAKILGWTKIAAVFVDFDDVQAAGYGVADNRTAELAKWDLEAMSRIESLLQEQGDENGMIGWTSDELALARELDWSPPVFNQSEDEEYAKGSKNQDNGKQSVSFNDGEWELVRRAVETMRDREFVDGQNEDSTESDFSDGFCLGLICREWLGEDE